MYIQELDFVNVNVINIFTDASMWPQFDGTTIGCYGFLTMHIDKEINSGMFIDTISTVNRSEIKGIKLAVMEAIRLRSTGFNGIINIFSDSQISVLGIRERIFDWKYNGDVNLYNKSNEPVANQSEYIEIMQLIIKYNPMVNFYHQKGHVDIHNPKLVHRACSTFKRSNFPNDSDTTVDMKFIKFISKCNNEIDNRTRWNLRNYVPMTMTYKDPFKFVPMDNYLEQLSEYNKIMGGNN